MKFVTNYGKSELNLTSSLMHMLNITAQKNISAAQTPVLFRSKNPKSWGKKLIISVTVQNICQIC